MATTISELYRLADELRAKATELTGADPDLVFVTLSLHGVGTAQVVIDQCNRFATTPYATETARWDGDPEDGIPQVEVMVFSKRGERLVLPPEPEPVVEAEVA